MIDIELPDHWPIICGTGHRRIAPDDFRWVDGELTRVVGKLEDEYGLTELVSGMALGFDLRWAEIGLFSNLYVHAMVPFPGQADAWPIAEADYWHEVLRAVSQTTLVSDLDPEPGNHRQTAAMLHARNDAMLNYSKAVVACADATQLKFSKTGSVLGGTWSAVHKAVKRKQPIIWIDPKARTVKRPSIAAWNKFFQDRKEKARERSNTSQTSERSDDRA